MTLHFPTGVLRPVLACVTALMTLSLAQAHGPAEWIQRALQENAAGELCCGERDCFRTDRRRREITSSGYFVVSMKRRSRSKRRPFA